MRLGSNVLVATDLSEAADEAIRQGYDRARTDGGELVVCHVVPDMLRDHPLFPQRVADDTERLLGVEKQAALAIEARVETVTGAKVSGGPVKVRVVVESGTPETVIVRVADEVHATLVVVSSRGTTGLERLLLGSVASRVVRYAHGPVLVARPGGKTGRVLGATDFSDPALPAIAAAVAEARARGAKVTLVHALDVFPRAGIGWGAPFGASWVVPPKEMVDEVRKSAEDALRGELERFGVAADEGDTCAVIGDAATAILDTARDLHAELVVVATSGRTGLRRMVLGSVAERVVSLASCSVLVVRSVHAPST